MDPKQSATTLTASEVPQAIAGGVEKDMFKFELTDFGTSYKGAELGPYLCICNGCNCLCWAAKQ